MANENKKPDKKKKERDKLFTSMVLSGIVTVGFVIVAIIYACSDKAKYAILYTIIAVLSAFTFLLYLIKYKNKK